MSSMCTIGVNAYEANIAHRVGSNMYAYRLLIELEKHTRPAAEHEKDSIPMFDWTIFLPSAPLPDMPAERPGWKYRIVGPSVLWTQWRLPLALYTSKTRFDAFLSLGHYAPRLCPFPSIVCIMDLAYLKFPQFFLKKDLYQLTEWTKYSIKQASHVVTISENSKADIQQAYGVAADDISIVYPGIDLHSEEELPLQAQQAILSEYGLTKRTYIASIGTIQPRKNMINVIHAFEQLVEAQTAHIQHLVFVGKPGWMTAEFDQVIAASPHKDKIIVTGFVSDTIKATLLKNAGCSVLVGYYEGFGIPPLESMSKGIVPVVANAGSLPEVVGEFGILVDPYSIDSIARGFAQAFQSPPSAMQISRMIEWSNRFSWETSAHVMIDLIARKYSHTS